MFALFSGVGCADGKSSESVAEAQLALCAKTKVSANSLGPVAIGAAITLTASSPSCAVGDTPEYQFSYRRDGAEKAYHVFRSYGSAPVANFDTTGLVSGKYTLVIDSRAVGSAAIRESKTSLDVLVGSTCASVALSSTLSTPQAPGVSVGLSAAATCTGGTPEYRFQYLTPGAPSYTLLQDWGGATVTWETLGLPVGPYLLLVDSRVSGNTSSTEATLASPFRLGELCSAVVGSATPNGAAPGTLVTLQGSSTCSHGAPADFRFFQRMNGTSAWIPVGTWSPGPTLWNTQGLPPGTYRVRAEARASDYAGPAEASSLFTTTLGGNCASVGLSASPSSPQAVGAPVTLLANAACTTGTPEYRFSWLAPGAGAYVELRGWAADSSLPPDLSGAAGGLHTFLVEARGLGSAGPAQSAASMSYLFGDVCTRVTLKVAPPSPQPAGTLLTLTATGECTGSALPEYRFLYLDSPTYVPFRDWGPNVATLATASLPVGSRRIRVEARAQGHTGAAEIARNVAYVLGAACPSGHVPNGANGCADIDECAGNNGGCDPLVACTNTPGGRVCDACPSGYTGSGDTACVAIDPCSPNPCQNGGACVGAGEGHSCTCIAGFAGVNCEVAPAKLLAVGDIGDCATTHDTATALLLDAYPGTIAALGDIAYPNGSTTDFANCFQPQWGRHKSRISPVPGNHEYGTSGAAGYFTYFGAVAGEPTKGYYSYDLGTWHIVALNSNCGSISGGCGAGSAQEQWLRADLSQSAALCTLAYFHHPRFTSGEHGDDSSMGAIWQALYDNGAEVVLSGHDHDYERWAPMNNTKVATPDGVVQFVVGTGGTGLRSFPGSKPANSVVRDAATHGVLELTLKAGSYDWVFHPVAGKTFTDSGSANCH